LLPIDWFSKPSDDFHPQTAKHFPHATRPSLTPNEAHGSGATDILPLKSAVLRGTYANIGGVILGANVNFSVIAISLPSSPQIFTRLDGGNSGRDPGAGIWYLGSVVLRTP